MALTPVWSAPNALREARLRIIKPQPASEQEAVIPFRFNPGECQIQKQNNFAEIAIPGLETPPIQYVGGASETLSVELLFDTSDCLEDVRKVYVRNLRRLLEINSDLHAPPIVSFTWGHEDFRGVIDSLAVTYTLFSPDGTPLRAKVSMSLKEYRTVEEQVRKRPKFSPDVEKTYVVRRGDSLSGIAERIYRDPTRWREIARANRVHDPRRVATGTVLELPRLALEVTNGH
jgi:nucleoid-associated protein YgaU